MPGCFLDHFLLHPLHRYVRILFIRIIFYKNIEAEILKRNIIAYVEILKNTMQF